MRLMHIFVISLFAMLHAAVTRIAQKAFLSWKYLRSRVPPQRAAQSILLRVFQRWAS